LLRLIGSRAREYQKPLESARIARRKRLRDRHGVEHLDGSKVRLEPIESAGARSEIQCHRSGPEASCAVALAIVHPVSRHVCFDLADQPGLGPFAVEQGEPVTYREDKASVRTKRDGADWLAYVDRLVVTAPCVEAMDALGGNIDPDELAALGVPEGPFTDGGVGVEGDLDLFVPPIRLIA